VSGKRFEKKAGRLRSASIGENCITEHSCYLASKSDDACPGRTAEMGRQMACRVCIVFARSSSFLPRASQAIGKLWKKADANPDPRIRAFLLYMVEQSIPGLSV